MGHDTDTSTGQQRKKYENHGQHQTRLYRIWAGIVTRCYNSKASGYHNYGGRGIRMHEPWRMSFATFADAVGSPPDDFFSLDRYPNVNGNYEPGNVRWATRKQQSENTRRAVQITYQGRTQCLTAWATEYGTRGGTLSRWITRYGVDGAFTQAAEAARLRSLGLRPYARDLTDQPFGRLTARRPAATPTRSGKVKWVCECSCGRTATVCSNLLVRGHTQSCGCIHNEAIRRKRPGSRPDLVTNLTHGGRTQSLSAWLTELGVSYSAYRTRLAVFGADRVVSALAGWVSRGRPYERLRNAAPSERPTPAPPAASD